MADAKLCDAKCLYAMSDDCDCKNCGGAHHGSGINNMEDPIWVKKITRLSKTRKAFRKELNAKEPRSGTRLYRHHREEFDAQYAIWSGRAEESKPEEIVTVHSKGMGPDAEITVIKDATAFGDHYEHIRLPNGKTQYKKNGKIITKGDVHGSLQW